MSDDASPSKLIHRWFQGLWCDRNRALIDEMVDAQCVVIGLTESDIRGPEPFHQFYDQLVAAFADSQVVIEDEIEQGDKVFIRCRATFTTHDGRVGQLQGACAARFRDGKYIEAWNAWDWLSLFSQLGVAPFHENTMLDALASLQRSVDLH